MEQRSRWREAPSRGGAATFEFRNVHDGTNNVTEWLRETEEGVFQCDLATPNVLYRTGSLEIDAALPSC